MTTYTEKRGTLKFLLIAFIGILLVFANPVHSQESELTIEDDSFNSQSTDEKINAIAREIEVLKSEKAIFKPAPEQGRFGVGPAASKVYGINSGVSIGGYGEIHYEHYDKENESGNGSGKTNDYDALRAILYFGYKFNDWILLNTEFEFEHADEAYLEFAYLDFMFDDAFNLRVGLLLLPMGIVNELHESPTFLPVNRSETESRIIPSTWRENGIGFYGSLADFTYRGMIVNGMAGADADPFNSSGLRGGRQKGSQAKADNLAGALRVDYEGLPGTILGVAGYYGGSGQDAGFTAETAIFDFHLDTKWQGIYVRALFAMATVADADRIASRAGLAANGINTTVGEQMIGYYGELGYDVLDRLPTTQKLIFFGRYEHINTQAKIAAGYAKDNSKERTIYTTGVSWKPISQIAMKTDFVFEQNKAGTGFNAWNMAMTYLF